MGGTLQRGCMQWRSTCARTRCRAAPSTTSSNARRMPFFWADACPHLPSPSSLLNSFFWLLFDLPGAWRAAGVYLEGDIFWQDL